MLSCPITTVTSIRRRLVETDWVCSALQTVRLCTDFNGELQSGLRQFIHIKQQVIDVSWPTVNRSDVVKFQLPCKFDDNKHCSQSLDGQNKCSDVIELGDKLMVQTLDLKSNGIFPHISASCLGFQKAMQAVKLPPGSIIR